MAMDIVLNDSQQENETKTKALQRYRLFFLPVVLQKRLRKTTKHVTRNPSINRETTRKLGIQSFLDYSSNLKKYKYLEKQTFAI
ncbi:MAG: hypothetical protein K8953_00390 [Proteobacteria bacterium]|nr:hypothetical protein [Pseudomonadota bacterium]